MIDISFQLNGKKVNPNNIGSALESAMLNSISDSIKKSVNSIRCSNHSQKAKILLKGKSLDNLSIEVSGCCDEFINKVQNSLK